MLASRPKPIAATGRHLRIQGLAYKQIVALLTKHRHLTWELTKREVTSRYAGQVFGAFWAVAHPLILIGVYVFIFSFVFQFRIGGTRELPLDYTAYLLSGLAPWLGMQAALVQSSTAITSESALVKQVIFPLEVLPVRTVLAALFTLGVTLTVVVVYVTATHGTPHWTYLLLPVVLLIHILWATGFGYILAAAGTYLRDTKDLVQIGTFVSLYMLPIFYLPAQVPSIFRPIIYINPFSYLIWCYRDVLYFGRFEHPWAWVFSAVFGVLIFGLGYRLFRRLKVMFGNVL